MDIARLRAELLPSLKAVVPKLYRLRHDKDSLVVRSMERLWGLLSCEEEVMISVKLLLSYRGKEAGVLIAILGYYMSHLNHCSLNDLFSEMIHSLVDKLMAFGTLIL